MSKISNERFFLTVVALVSIFTCVFPFLYIEIVKDFDTENLRSCMGGKYSEELFDFCYDSSRRKEPSFWYCFFLFLPAMVIIWINWVCNFNFKVIEQKFFNYKLYIFLEVTFIILSLLCVFLPILSAITNSISDTVPKDFNTIYHLKYNEPLIFGFGFIGGFWLFSKLCAAPREDKRSWLISKIVILPLFAPLLMFLIVAIREYLNN